MGSEEGRKFPVFNQGVWQRCERSYVAILPPGCHLVVCWCRTNLCFYYIRVFIMGFWVIEIAGPISRVLSSCSSGKAAFKTAFNSCTRVIQVRCLSALKGGCDLVITTMFLLFSCRYFILRLPSCVDIWNPLSLRTNELSLSLSWIQILFKILDYY